MSNRPPVPPPRSSQVSLPNLSRATARPGQNPLISPRNVSNPRGNTKTNPIISPRNLRAQKAPQTPPRRNTASFSGERPPTLPPHPSGNPLFQPNSLYGAEPTAPQRNPPPRNSSQPQIPPRVPSQQRPPRSPSQQSFHQKNVTINELSQPNVPRANERRAPMPTMVAMPSSQVEIKNARKV